MENNLDKRKGISFVALIFYIFIIYAIISSIVRFFVGLNENLAQKERQNQKQNLIAEKNLEIEYVTALDETFFTNFDEYIEFENGIKIPMPTYILENKDIISFKKAIETNQIAYKSPVVKFNYNGDFGVVDMYFDMFQQKLKDYNYTKVIYVFKDGTDIYTREEADGYFSYMIFKGTELTLRSKLWRT